MARDNGKRGFYRHVSGSQLEAQNPAGYVEHDHDYDHDHDHEHSSPIPTSPTDSNVSPPLPTNFKNLRRDKIDDLGLLGDSFFDSVPSSLNAKYPIMAIPRSLPRRSLSPEHVGMDQPPTWTQMALVTGLYGFALFGFLFTMCSGFSAVGAYLWAVVATLFGKGA